MSGMSVTSHHTWKFNVPHSFGVHHAVTPDPYRGPWRGSDPEAGQNYAADVQNLIQYATSGQIAGFIAESIQGVGGVVVFPDGYLKHAYEHVRAAGGVCIADEVQAGFGRTGSMFGCRGWGVKPDLMVFAKGINSGYVPLGATLINARVEEAFSSDLSCALAPARPKPPSAATTLITITTDLIDSSSTASVRPFSLNVVQIHLRKSKKIGRAHV